MCQGKLRIVRTEDAMKELGLTEHSIRFTSSANVTAPGTLPQVSEAIFELIKSRVQDDDGSLQVSWLIGQMESYEDQVLIVMKFLGTIQ